MTNLMTTGFCELNEQEMMETEGGDLVLALILIIGVGAEVATYIGVCNSAKSEAIAAQQKADLMEAKYNYAVATGDWSVMKA